MQDFEKLGAFYLGKHYDLEKAAATDELVLYDSKDLVTHAVCVGMTGSGKTGLCIATLEEAALDGIPAIVIDPKGDLANLLLTFPQLRAEDFAPWINEDDARRKGLSPQDYAQKQAETWTKGLADWGQDGARIEQLRNAADFLIYTPGSTAGLPVSILKSFAAPGHEVRDDADLFRDRINTTATSLLGLLGVDADPIQSREHILISNLLSTAWQQGKDLDLGALIQQIQQPPFERIGVLDVESFYPSKDRFALAMRMNNLLAAPGFEAWMKGEALDVNEFLHTSSGKPRISIFSIAHLGDAERMFFVSLLLNQVLGWMRTQSGTTSLRAMLYMDEIFGFFPPVANPPSKAPLLTLLKQARAFGVGVMLATQNPVDLDYKGLSNAGTWFIGRLQTERDKARVLDGLEGAAAATSSRFDRDQMEQLISGLGNRVFLMNNVHDDGPEVFQTRWCMSYLRGPLTRNQIKVLMDERRGEHEAARGRSKIFADKTAAPAVVPAAAAPVPAPAAPATPPPGTSMPVPGATSAPASAMSAAAAAQKSARPVLPPEVPQLFLPVRSVQPEGASLRFTPVVLGVASVYFRDSKSGIDAQQDMCLLVPFGQGAVVVDFAHATILDLPESELEKSPTQEGEFALPPPAASQARNYEGWRKSLTAALYRTSKLDLLRSPTLKKLSNPGESERDFRARLAQAIREQRDAAIEKLKKKYAPKIAALQERKRRAEQARQVQAEQARSAKLSTAISFGATVLGALFGRKKLSTGNVSRAGTAARGVGRSMKESQDITRAEQNIQAIQQQMADLDAQFQSEVNSTSSKLDPATEPLETISLRAKKSDITAKVIALGWAPHWQIGAESTPAWM